MIILSAVKLVHYLEGALDGGQISEEYTGGLSQVWIETA